MLFGSVKWLIVASAVNLCSVCVAQSITDILSESVRKTTTWGAQLYSFDVECVETLTINTQSPTKPGFMANSIVRFREFKNDIEKRFFVAWCRSSTLINSTDGRRNIETSVRFGSQESGTKVERIGQYQRGSMILSGSTGDCEDAAKESNWNEWPLLTRPIFFQSMEHRNLKLALDYLLDLPNNSISLSNEKLSTSEKTVKVLRAKKIVGIKGQEPDFALTWKIVISDQGFDKGFILQFVEGRMKTTEMNNEFISDSQLDSTHNINVSTQWSEFESEVPADQVKKCVLPVLIVHQYQSAPTIKAIKTRTLNWKGFGLPPKEMLNIDACLKLSEEYAKTIDKAPRE